VGKPLHRRTGRKASPASPSWLAAVTNRSELDLSIKFQEAWRRAAARTAIKDEAGIDLGP
jgi:hypothetical protein